MSQNYSRPPQGQFYNNAQNNNNNNRNNSNRGPGGYSGKEEAETDKVSRPAISSSNSGSSESKSTVKHSEITEVVIDGLALLKITKHCNENLPSMVAGSLLGIDIDGVVEITYAYPYPQPSGKNNGDDGGDVEYQMEMMKLLSHMNIDNNVVGWYQSMYMGTVCTNDVIDFQYSFQTSEDLAGNSVVLMYDPLQTKKGSLCIKAYRLSDKFLQLKRSKNNDYIKPAEIFEELPVRIKNSGHISAYLRCLENTHQDDIDENFFEPLSLVASDSHAEKHLELLGSWIDDLVVESGRLHIHAKATGKPRMEYIRWLAKRRQENFERSENGETLLSTRLEDSGVKHITDPQNRLDPLLDVEQIERYCGQLNAHVDSTMTKVIVSSLLASK